MSPIFSTLRKFVRYCRSLPTNDRVGFFLSIGLSFLIVIASLLGDNSRYVWAETIITSIALLLLFFSVRLEWFPHPFENRWVLVVLALIATTFTSTLSSVNAFNSIVQVMRLGVAAAMLLLAFRLSAAQRNRSLMIDGILFASAAVALMGIIEFFQSPSAAQGIGSTFGWRNLYGGFLLLVLPISLIAAMESQTRWRLGVSIVLTSLLLTSLFFTFSQASWMAAIVEIGVIVGVFLRSVSLSRLAIIALLSIVLSWSLVWTHSLVYKDGAEDIAKESGLHTLSIANRLEYWRMALEMFQDYPIMGVGAGNYYLVNTRYQQNVWSYSKYPHNLILQYLAETGIIGLLAALAFWGFVFRAVIRDLQSPTSNLQHPTVGLSAAIIGSFLHMMLDFDNIVPVLTLLLFIEIGMLIRVTQVSDSAQATEPLKIHRVVLVGATALFFSALLINNLADMYANQSQEQLRMMGYSSTSLRLALKARMLNPYNPAYRDLITEHLLLLAATNPSGSDAQPLKEILTNAKKAARLNPQSANTHYLLGNTYNAMAKFDPTLRSNAIAELKQTIAQDGYNHPSRYLTLAKAYIENGDMAKAQQTLADGIVRFTDDGINNIFLDENRKTRIRNEIIAAKGLYRKLKDGTKK